MAGEKTEKATPKRQAEARRKGQVAKSQELSGSLVTLAGLFAVSAFGPRMAERCAEAMRSAFVQVGDPSVVSLAGIGELFRGVGVTVVAAVAPIMFTCMVVGVLAGVGQVGLKPTPGALKPSFAKLDPIKGAKNILGPNALFMLATNVLKLVVIGAVVWLVLGPNIGALASLVGAGPDEVVAELTSASMKIARYGAMGWFLLAIADFFWQRHRHEKQLRMDKQEVKDEHKQQSLPGEIKAAQRRRAMQLARQRMMDDVPTADVVVTNPTHFAVALKYEPTSAAPLVVAKGQDLLAARIRELATEHGVPLVPDPPLARALHAGVEVGQQIPEELYQAVARVLAFVFRMAQRRSA